jgi:hypothetical protein
MFGPNWPYGGEIDIIEGVSLNTRNLMSLHTAPGCQMPPSPQYGSVTSTQCDAFQNYNQGCGVTGNNPLTYGSGFNSVGGGVYAVQWTSAHIKIWHFARNNGIPSDIQVGRPNPATWGQPHAFFKGSKYCNLDSKMKNQHIVINTNFCGDWAGNSDIWRNDPVCGRQASSCVDYVARNPQAFAGA